MALTSCECYDVSYPVTKWVSHAWSPTLSSLPLLFHTYSFLNFLSFDFLRGLGLWVTAPMCFDLAVSAQRSEDGLTMLLVAPGSTRGSGQQFSAMGAHFSYSYQAVKGSSD